MGCVNTTPKQNSAAPPADTTAAAAAATAATNSAKLDAAIQHADKVAMQAVVQVENQLNQAVKSASSDVDKAAQLVSQATTQVEQKINQAVVSAQVDAKMAVKKQGTLNLGEPIPNFECDTTQGKIKLHEYFGTGWGILFSHP